MNIQLSFLGAAGNVTGSRYLLEFRGKKLLVDCGLYQEHDLKARNWQKFQFDPRELCGVILTHGHLDHCGLLPRLVKDGFHGKIHGTGATVEIAKIVLADCAKINEEDAQFKRKRHEKEGRKTEHPEEPLYTLEEAEAVTPLFEGHSFNRPFDVAEGITIQFQEVGHILGAAFVKIILQEGKEYRTLIFSGDVGRENMPILRDPAAIGQADYLVCESTYGNRIHGAQEDIPAKLAQVVNETVRAGGNLVIPSFAVERTQDLLYYLAILLKEDKIPHLQIFVDSPMAIRVTDIFKHNGDLVDEETVRELGKFRMPGLTMVRSIADSKGINRIRGTAIIIAGAGMCTGGRIKHHLYCNLPRKESTILFIGYQAEQTLGREILSGAKKVRVLGEEVLVEARVEQISGFSAHADQQELLDWMETTQGTPKKLFITHGEKSASEALEKAVRQRLEWNVMRPQYEEKVTLE